MVVRLKMPGWTLVILPSVTTLVCVYGFALSPVWLGTRQRQERCIWTPLGLGLNGRKRKVGPNIGIVFKPVFPTTKMFVGTMDAPPSRFDRTADREMKLVQEECLLEIDGLRYNLTAWAKAHPGGVSVLRKFHNKDASKAFHAAAHSVAAYAMLKDFLVSTDDNDKVSSNSSLSISPESHPTATMPTSLSTTWKSKRPRWQQKLFTKEDPIGVHKYLGIFCLLVSFFSVCNTEICRSSGPQ